MFWIMALSFALSFVITTLVMSPSSLEFRHLPRLPKFESRRVRDHRRCLASIARLERELGMESTEQLRETLFGIPTPVKLLTDEPGQLVELTQALTEVREREGARPRQTWDEAYRSSYARGYTNGRTGWQREGDPLPESSDRFEVF